MLLAIDVGNTQTVVGVMQAQSVLTHWRLTTNTGQTADELGMKLTALLQRWQRCGGSKDPSPPSWEAIVVCSTVPAQLLEMRRMCDRFFPETPAVILETALEVGVNICTDNPLQVGTDRVINALAVSSIYQQPAICVDCGTATTFDVVDSSGNYLGGAIAPGIQLSLEALAARGAQLHKVDISAPEQVIGRNTADALRSGVVFGFSAQIDGMVSRLGVELAKLDSSWVEDKPPLVVATGGLASVILPHSATITVHDPWLTLKGLSLVFQRRKGRVNK